MAVSSCMNYYTGCRALSDLEIEAISQGFSGKYSERDRAIFLTGIYTGFRISEILSLSIGDVLLPGGKITNTVCVNKAWMKGRKESRTSPLHHHAQDSIKLWISARDIESLPYSAPLFPCQCTQKKLSPKTYWRVLKAAAMTARISPERLGTHSMRKSFASRLWSSEYVGKDIAKMALILGHRDPSNTLRYIQFLDGSLEAAILSAA
jgi:integrase